MGTIVVGLVVWDLWFWDDTLPMGDGVGSTVDGAEVAAYVDGHYVLRTTVDVPTSDAKVVLTKPKRLAMGDVVVQASDYGNGKIIGLVMPKTLPLAPCASFAACGVPATAWPDRKDGHGDVTFRGKSGPALVVPAPIPDGPDLRVLDDRAPFPVLATFRKDGRIVVFAGEVELAADAFVAEKGDTVTLLDHRKGTVSAVSGDRLTVKIPAGERTAPLPNPNDRVVPAWTLLLGAAVGGAAVGGAALVKRKRG